MSIALEVFLAPVEPNVAGCRPMVLFVDDDVPIRDVVKAILKRQGYAIDEAGDSEDALAKVKADHYGAIVLDLMLPKLSGYEVRNYLSRERPNSKCVVIISAAPAREIDQADPTVVKAVLRKAFRHSGSRCRRRWLYEQV